MKNTLTLLTLALSATLVNAQTVDNWVSTSGTQVTNSTGLCWRNSSWTPATAHPDCDGAIKPVAVAAAPKVDITKPTAVIAARASAPTEAKKVTLSTDALFDFDKTVIKAQGKEHLDMLIDQINHIDLELAIVVGHTDSVGTEKYNMKLGQRRADAVKAYLVSKGIDSKRIYTESKGESKPIASNKTSKERALNGRVEIEVVGKAR